MGTSTTMSEARKLLLEQMGATLITIAKDVKIQVEFNPAEVTAYRLIGYENRALRAEEFNDDTKDAGEIGAGHTVTAIYEVVPAGQNINIPGVDPLKYQTPGRPTSVAGQGELLTVKLRYKKPDGATSSLLTHPVRDSRAGLSQTTADFRFAAAVAAFGMLLRDSQYKGNATYQSVIDLALSGRGDDRFGYRAEMINLVRNAQAMAGR